MAEEPKVSVQLTVNDQDVSLNEFAQRITMNILTGIVKSLKIDDEVKTAGFELKIE